MNQAPAMAGKADINHGKRRVNRNRRAGERFAVPEGGGETAAGPARPTAAMAAQNGGSVRRIGDPAFPAKETNRSLMMESFFKQCSLYFNMVVDKNKRL